MAVNPINIYRRQIEKELQADNATEPTHRPAENPSPSSRPEDHRHNRAQAC